MKTKTKISKLNLKKTAIILGMMAGLSEQASAYCTWMPYTHNRCVCDPGGHDYCKSQYLPAGDC